MINQPEKCVALILAGGLGIRMGDAVNVPKQFYQMTDKPLLIHTVEVFENHPDIDLIQIVCLDGWEEYLWNCLDKFSIQKVADIVTGGATRHQSVHNGLKSLESICSGHDIIIVHDGVRPFINATLLSRNIEAVRENGSAMTSIQSSDSLLISKDSNSSSCALVRNSVFLVQTPQCYRYERGLSAYNDAPTRGIASCINCCELFIALGQTVHLVPGLKTNIKLTTAEDIDFLHAIYNSY